jgi:hypothetical protein
MYRWMHSLHVIFHITKILLIGFACRQIVINKGEKKNISYVCLSVCPHETNWLVLDLNSLCCGTLKIMPIKAGQK